MKARILQLRRGTTAENDGFVGLPGEVVFDTDAKTLRVHDGQTIGGYALARADMISTTPGTGGDTNNGAGGCDCPDIGDIPTCDCPEPTPPFDINTVPDEFWQNLMARFPAPAQFRSMVLGPNKIGSSVYIEIQTNEITTTPAFVQPALVCQTAEAGYTPGDIVPGFGVGDYSMPMVYMYHHDINGLCLRLMVGKTSFWVPHRDTGSKTNITAGNWKLQITVWY